KNYDAKKDLLDAIKNIANGSRGFFSSRIFRLAAMPYAPWIRIMGESASTICIASRILAVHWVLLSLHCTRYSISSLPLSPRLYPNKLRSWELQSWHGRERRFLTLRIQTTRTSPIAVIGDKH